MLKRALYMLKRALFMSSPDLAWFRKNGLLESFWKQPAQTWLLFFLLRISLPNNRLLMRGWCLSEILSKYVCVYTHTYHQYWGCHRETPASHQWEWLVSLFVSPFLSAALPLTRTHTFSLSLSHTLSLFPSLSLFFSLSFSVCHSQNLIHTHTKHTLALCCACADTLARAHPLSPPRYRVVSLPEMFFLKSFWNVIALSDGQLAKV